MTEERIEEIRSAAETVKTTPKPLIKATSPVVKRYLRAISPDTVLALIAELATLRTRAEKAEGVVAKLPKTADGVPVVPGDELWIPPGYYGKVLSAETDRMFVGAWIVQDGIRQPRAIAIFKCYSTREAAESALDGARGGSNG